MMMMAGCSVVKKRIKLGDKFQDRINVLHILDP